MVGWAGAEREVGAAGFPLSCITENCAVSRITAAEARGRSGGGWSYNLYPPRPEREEGSVTDI
jgi:hypothetical protein